MQTRELNYHYSIIKIFSILCVITMHIFLGSKYLFLDKYSFDWYFSVFLYTISRVGVPLFFMVSGALILNKQRDNSLKSFLKKRLLRVVPPLIFWTYFYYLFFNYYLQEPRDLSVINMLFKPEVLPHLWFLYVIIGLYLLTPVFQIFLQYSPTRVIVYYLFIWIIFSGLHFYGTYFLGMNIGEAYGLFPTALSSYCGYYILGYLLTNRENDIKLSNKALVTMYGIGLIVSLILNNFENISNRDNINYSGQFLTFTNINIVLMSIPIFIWLSRVQIKSSKKITIYNSLGGTVFGIYLCHEAVLQILRHNLFFSTLANPCLYYIVFLLITYIVSLVTVYLIKNIFSNIV